MQPSGEHNTTKILPQRTLRGMVQQELAEDVQQNQSQRKCGREELRRNTPWGMRRKQ